MLREGLAAVGVMLSLVFVGYEIRQNTQVSWAAAIQGATDQSLQTILAWSEDEQAVTLLGRLLNGEVPSNFTNYENTKPRLIYLAALRVAESRYRQSMLGILEDPTILAGPAAFLRAPYLFERWDRLKPAVSADFAEDFEVEYGLR
jgi:hypothetical protein